MVNALEEASWLMRWSLGRAGRVGTLADVIWLYSCARLLTPTAFLHLGL